MRYKEPDGANRCESPLFQVVGKEDEAPDVWTVLLGSKDRMNTNHATAPSRASLGGGIISRNSNRLTTTSSLNRWS